MTDGHRQNLSYNIPFLPFEYGIQNRISLSICGNANVTSFILRVLDCAFQHVYSTFISKRERPYGFPLLDAVLMTQGSVYLENPEGRPMSSRARLSASDYNNEDVLPHHPMTHLLVCTPLSKSTCNLTVSTVLYQVVTLNNFNNNFRNWTLR